MKTYQFDFPSNKSHSFTHLVNGIYYKVHILYDTHTDSYYMNIDKYNNTKFENIINSIRLSTGIDLFIQYRYLNLGKFFVIPATDKQYRNDPKASTIKTNYFILWEHN